VISKTRLDTRLFRVVEGRNHSLECHHSIALFEKAPDQAPIECTIRPDVTRRPWPYGVAQNPLRRRESPIIVFEPFAKKQKASWLVNDSVPHSFTYTPDAAQSLLQLAERATAWNQTWHVPATPNPLTGKEFVALTAKEFAVAQRYRVLSRPILRILQFPDQTAITASSASTTIPVAGTV
jgi:hypothetical protein